MKKSFSILVLIFVAFAGLTFSACNDDTTEDNWPADAGTITGADSGEISVELQIAEIAYADTYRWYRDDVAINGETSRTLVVTQTGTYTVAGVNNLGEGKRSPEKHVEITGEPALEEPEDAGEITITSQTETQAVLTIAAIDRATTYRWYKDGKVVQTNTSRNYAATESGKYKVAGVNNAGEGKASPELDITIGTIVELPADAGEIQGEEYGEANVMLTIEPIEGATGYRWYDQDGNVVKTSTAISRTYTVRKSGTYTVAGFNAAGEGKASPPKTVEVEYVTMSNASARYWGDDVAEDTYYIGLELTWELIEDLQYEGINLGMFINKPADPTRIVIPEGTYTVDQNITGAPFTLGAGVDDGSYKFSFTYEFEEYYYETTSYTLAKSGSVEVISDGGQYVTIKTDLVGENEAGEEVNMKYYFKGYIQPYDVSPNVYDTDFNYVWDARYALVNSEANTYQFYLSFGDATSYMAPEFTNVRFYGLSEWDGTGDFVLADGIYPLSTGFEVPSILVIDGNGNNVCYYLEGADGESTFDVALTDGYVEVQSTGANTYDISLVMTGQYFWTAQTTRVICGYSGELNFTDFDLRKAMDMPKSKAPAQTNPATRTSHKVVRK